MKLLNGSLKLWDIRSEVVGPEAGDCFVQVAVSPLETRLNHQ